VLVGRIVLVGVLLLVAAFGLFLLALERWAGSLAEARTVAVNVFVAGEVVYLFNCRSLRLPLSAIPLFSNPWVWAGAGVQIALQLLITYWPPMHAAFGTAPISLQAWSEIAAIAVISVLVIELFKRLQVGARQRTSHA
jgi:cation-transporting ATPase F